MFAIKKKNVNLVPLARDVMYLKDGEPHVL